MTSLKTAAKETTCSVKKRRGLSARPKQYFSIGKIIAMKFLSFFFYGTDQNRA